MKFVRIGLVLIVLGLFMSAAAITTAVELENRDTFCAACHTEPETTFFARSEAESSDLASAHANAEAAVRCIDCHSGVGPVGRAASLVQGANDLSAFVLGSYEQPATTIYPIGEEGCTKCHHAPTSVGLADSEFALKSYSHYHRAEYAAAWLAADPDSRGTCAVCHVSHSEGARESQQWSPRPAVNAACDDCHADLDDWTPLLSNDQ